MITAYFWKDGKVVEYTDFTESSRVRRAALGKLFCVDMTATTPVLKYGMYSDYGWKHVPLSEFPKEFLAMLLIMGIGNG